MGGCGIQPADSMEWFGSPPGSEKPEGFGIRILGSCGWRLKRGCLVQRSIGFLQPDGTGPFVAQWKGWEGTSHFVIFDPVGACAGHLNFNKKHVAGG